MLSLFIGRCLTLITLNVLNLLPGQPALRNPTQTNRPFLSWVSGLTLLDVLPKSSSFTDLSPSLVLGLPTDRRSTRGLPCVEGTTTLIFLPQVSCQGRGGEPCVVVKGEKDTRFHLPDQVLPAIPTSPLSHNKKYNHQPESNFLPTESHHPSYQKDRNNSVHYLRPGIQSQCRGN